jgi:hypothetical protein
MHKAKGYGPKWIRLVESILHSASTSVLLNGVPGKKIVCKRGVRQGDPLSPLLFVNTAELLQAAVNFAWQQGDISLPLDESFGQKYPILQYADDTLLIMPADAVQLNRLKDILRLFSASTGLQVNFHKTTIVPINIDTDHAQALAQSFGCKVESLPFTYLGLPLGTTRPSVNDLMPLVSKLDKRLSGISSLMTYTGSDEGMTNGLPIFAYLVFGPGRVSFGRLPRPTKASAWRGPRTILSMQAKLRRVQVGLVFILAFVLKPIRSVLGLRDNPETQPSHIKGWEGGLETLDTFSPTSRQSVRQLRVFWSG